MTRTFTIGALDESTHRLGNISLPVITDLPIIDWMQDALTTAASQRRAVALISAKGNGKTMALQHALRRFEETERAKQEASADYRRQYAQRVRSPRDDSSLNVLGTIWKAILGVEMAHLRRGRKRSVDDVRGELVHHLLNQNIAVLAFDEAEKLTPNSLAVIRDLLADAEEACQDRFGPDDQAFQSAGIGVLLSGTPRLRPRLRVWEEAEQRVLQVLTLQGLTLVEASDVYRAYLSAFEEAAQEDEEAWLELLRVHALRGDRANLRRIENHTRTYIRRMYLDDPDLVDLEDIPWDEEMFVEAIEELTFAKSGTDG